MSGSDNTPREVGCADVREHLAALVDGDEATIDRFAEHLASCDACRDLRHEAAELPALLARAGEGFALPEDLEAKVLSEVDQPTASGHADQTTASGRSDAGVAGSASTDGSERAVPPEGEQKRRPQAPAIRRLWPASAVVIAAAAAAVLAIALWPGEGARKSGFDQGDRGSQVAASNGPVVVLEVLRSSASGGLMVRAPGTRDFEPWSKGDEIAAGSAIRTDRTTRARIELADRTQLVLDHQTELELGASPAELDVRGGRLVAEVVPRSGGRLPPLTLSVPTGKIEVLGTRFLLTATDEGASVRVTRGRVKLLGAGETVMVDPGQEGLLPKEGVTRVVPGGSLAAAVGWSDLSPDDDPGVVGLGELRARRPGDAPDRARPLAIAHQKVSVRIVGNVARTEIEQSFENGTNAVLEGIYKFPLPADARIERLALDVKGAPGGFEEGAFVDRQRAKKIWAGVIRNATPKRKRSKNVEYIWVPGPWRDPALLQWERGSNFELRVFPIPKRGRRTVILAYTQVIQPSGDGRRYVYPLAHASDASTRVGRFDVDIRVAQTSPEQLAVLGYPLEATRRGRATELRFGKAQFVPSGDLVVDLPLPHEAELHYWTYQGEVATAPGTGGTRSAGRGTAPDPAVAAAQRRFAADPRPFVLFSLRPQLPEGGDYRPRDYAVVIDSSQSMVGERYTRASRLAAALIQEMDRRDRVTVLTCDFDCRSVSNGLEVPGVEQAAKVKRLLDAHEPAGSSNLAQALDYGIHRLDQLSSAGRLRQLVLIGDGMSTVGHRSAAALADVAEQLVGAAHAITTVGIGADADAAVLSAVARAGSGHFVPYIPGQPVELAALNVLETAYGTTLEHPELELPEGVVDMAPRQLPNLRAGQELLLAARFSGRPKGEVVLRGTAAGQPFERRYPIELVASTSRGNAFVPRQWAALQIDRLQLEAGEAHRAEVVGLSKAYGVMSRYTSMLVLESPAMFSAFGVDRARSVTSWTGDDELETGVASSVGARKTVGKPGAPSATLGKGLRSGAGAEGEAGPAAVRAMRSSRARPSQKAPKSDQRDALADLLDDAPKRKTERPRRPPLPVRQLRRRPGRWVKRVWFRVASVSSRVAATSREERRVRQAEQALAENPDSRDRQRQLVRALSRAGFLERAREAAEAWLTRDQLDAEALVYLSDAVGRLGDRQRALRLLSGIVDLEPESERYHRRMINAFARAGMLRRACDHRIALAGATRQSSALGEAVRCSRAGGDERSASLLLRQAADGSARLRIERAAAKPPDVERVRGDILLEASWDGEADLDLSLITPQGTRVSWLGGRRSVTARDVSSLGRETLALRRGSVGSYLIELSRVEQSAARQPIRGVVTIAALKERSRLRFTLEGDRVVVGRLRVRRESRLEELSVNDSGVRETLSRAQIASSLRQVSRRVQQRCSRTYEKRRVAPVRVTVAGTGRVSTVRVEGPLRGSATARCVEQTVRRFARFPRFNGPPVTTVYSMPLR
jgi:ferric-dicitrate binding protein FerR (iron transport regulator)/tetratricopeptide (TPR) repeat protein